MRKLRLDLEALAVESFDTQRVGGTVGTVKGREIDDAFVIAAPAPITPPISYTCNTCPVVTMCASCVASCETCFAPTCNSCGITRCFTGNAPECCT